MSIKLVLPTRICVVGATTSGKTELVKKMLIRGDFGKKEELEVFVYTPLVYGLKQPCWKYFEGRIRITCTLLTNKTPMPDPPAARVKRVIIFDDIDEAMKLPSWVAERFTGASHHLGESVVCISHKVKIGVTNIRNCSNWIILTSASEPSLKDSCDALGIPKEYDNILRIIRDPAGLVETSKNQWASFNHLVIKQTLCVDKDGKESSKYFKINDYSDVDCMSPIQITG